MKNFIQPGETLTLTPAINYKSGDPVLIGKFFGVFATDALANIPTEVTVEGVFSLPKAATIVFAVGAPVYWDAAASNLTSVTTSNTLIGAATKAAASADLTVDVRLNGVATP